MDILPQTIDFADTLNNIDVNFDTMHTETIASLDSHYVPILTGYIYRLNGKKLENIKKDKHGNITILIPGGLLSSSGDDMRKIWIDWSLMNVEQYM